MLCKFAILFVPLQINPIKMLKYGTGFIRLDDYCSGSQHSV